MGTGSKLWQRFALVEPAESARNADGELTGTPATLATINGYAEPMSSVPSRIGAQYRAVTSHMIQVVYDTDIGGTGKRITPKMHLTRDGVTYRILGIERHELARMLMLFVVATESEDPTS